MGGRSIGGGAAARGRVCDSVAARTAATEDGFSVAVALYCCHHHPRAIALLEGHLRVLTKGALGAERTHECARDARARALAHTQTVARKHSHTQAMSDAHTTNIHNHHTRRSDQNARKHASIPHAYVTHVDTCFCRSPQTHTPYLDGRVKLVTLKCRILMNLNTTCGCNTGMHPSLARSGRLPASPTPPPPPSMYPPPGTEVPLWSDNGQ